MQGLVNAITQSVLTRFLANLFLFLVLIDALALATYDLVTTGTVNSIVLTLLETGLGMALAILGINHGVTLAPLTVGSMVSSAVMPTSTPAPAESSAHAEPTVTVTTTTSSGGMQGH